MTYKNQPTPLKLNEPFLDLSVHCSSIHSYHALLFWMYPSTSILLKWGLFALKNAFAIPTHSNEALWNSYVSMHPQLFKTNPLQLKSSVFLIQMCLCASNTFKSNPLQLKCAFYTLCTLKWGLLQFICAMASSIYLNWAFFNSNVPDCTQPTQIISFSIQMALIASNVHSYIQHLQMRSSRTQRTLILSNVHNLHSTPSNQVIIFKDAQMYSTNSNHH